MKKERFLGIFIGLLVLWVIAFIVNEKSRKYKWNSENGIRKIIETVLIPILGVGTHITVASLGDKQDSLLLSILCAYLIYHIGRHAGMNYDNS